MQFQVFFTWKFPGIAFFFQVYPGIKGIPGYKYFSGDTRNFLLFSGIPGIPGNFQVKKNSIPGNLRVYLEIFPGIEFYHKIFMSFKILYLEISGYTWKFFQV